MKIFINILVIAFLIVLQWAVLPFAGVSALLPPLILPIAIAWAEVGRPTEAMVWGAVGLFICDLIVSAQGKLALAAVGAFILAYFGLRFILNLKGRFYAVVCSIISGVIYFVFLDAVLSLGGINAWSTFPGTLLPALFLGLAVWLIFPALHSAVRLVEIWESGRKSLLK